MYGGSRQIPENCRSEFSQLVGVGLEPLLLCLVSNRQFTYLLTAVKPGAVCRGSTTTETFLKCRDRGTRDRKKSYLQIFTLAFF